MSLIKVNLREKKEETEDVKEKAQIQILKPKLFEDFLTFLITQFDNAKSYELDIFAKNEKGENIKINNSNYSENYSEFTVTYKKPLENKDFNVDKIFEQFEEDYCVSSFIDREEVINKIIELNGNIEALRQWIEFQL